jgi:hypothetical protein
MRSFLACAIGMMIGSIVLIWAAVFKPHNLENFSDCCEKSHFLIKKGIDISE